ncbi:glycosyltransferase family 2 protein [Desulfovibrio sp.]|uniref:glycosyltransferase family 2 protein n=1 Tax=Desulfovibrio sp. TaxID=885 RepID=UPI003D0F7AE0
MQPHTVSIIIPCYNDGKYLPEAVASARAQSYPNIEIIIVNDYSTDPLTNSLLEKFAAEGITVINTTPGKKGLSAARNTAIKASSGEYILPLDADDKVDPTYVEKAVAVLASNPRVLICTSRVRFFGLRHNEWVQGAYSYANLVLEEYKILATSLFRRKDWARIGGYEESLTMGKEDMVFWLDILKDGGEAEILPEILIYYRIKPFSMSALRGGAPTECEKVAAMYAARPDLFHDHTIDFMCYCANFRVEKSQRECLFSWKLFSHLFRLEWFLRQKVKRLFGRA